MSAHRTAGSTFARPSYHWLGVRVVDADMRPLAGSRVEVRQWPRGATRPGQTAARSITGDDGAARLQLHASRYAVAASFGAIRRAVVLDLDHAGGITIRLDRVVREVPRIIDGLGVTATATAHAGIAAVAANPPAPGAPQETHAFPTEPRRGGYN